MSTKQKKGCLNAIFGIFGEQENNLDIEVVESRDKDPMPFALRDDFLSAAEHSFYHVLKSMMGNYFTICPKVSLSDIFYVTNPNRNKSAYNRINRKHVDFLICDTDTMKPRFGIELDDKTHSRSDRMDRDEFVEELYEKADLPLVRIPVRPTYNTNELGVLFREVLIKTRVSSPITVARPESTGTPAAIPQPKIVQSSNVNAMSESGEGHQVNSQPPMCPKCGQPMVMRTAEVGANKGKRFWGCVNYPKCKMVVAIDR